MILIKNSSGFKAHLCFILMVLLSINLHSQLNSIRTKAIAGDANAQLELGNLFFDGSGETPKAYPRAISWYRKALKNGNKAAAFNLAICYDAPYGVERDLKKAKELYLIAIKAGVKPALLNYALLEAELKHSEEAQRYLLMASDAGISTASRLYALTLKEDQSRLIYLKKASDLGDSIAMLLLADYYEKQQQLDQMVLYLKKSAGLQNPEAMVKLGFCYQTTYGVTKSYTKSRELFKSAAHLGNVLAVVEFGKLLLKEGRGGLAFQYFSYAAKMNNPIGLFMKGVCVNTGVGTLKNTKEAFILFEKSAKLGYVKAQYNTGLAFEQGVGITKSLTMAKYWYEKAASQEDVESYLSLAEFYFNGAGSIKMDKAKSIHYLERAEKLGSSEATKMLREYKNAIQ